MASRSQQCRMNQQRDGARPQKLNRSTVKTSQNRSSRKQPNNTCALRAGVGLNTVATRKTCENWRGPQHSGSEKDLNSRLFLFGPHIPRAWVPAACSSLHQTDLAFVPAHLVPRAGLPKACLRHVTPRPDSSRCPDCCRSLFLVWFMQRWLQAQILRLS